MSSTKLTWIFSEVLGWGGAALIFYSIIVTIWPDEKWMLMERPAEIVSTLLTLVGALVTAGSAYIKQTRVRQAWEWSTKIAAPVVIGGCIISIGFLIVFHQLPPVLVSGFGLLAISGSLKRSLSYPKELK